MTPQKIRIAFEHKKPDRYLQAYEAVREIMSSTAVTRSRKLQKIAMVIDAAESGMQRRNDISGRCAP